MHGFRKHYCNVEDLTPAACECDLGVRVFVDKIE